jgi:hypothetical protein
MRVPYDAHSHVAAGVDESVDGYAASQSAYGTKRYATSKTSEVQHAAIATAFHESSHTNAGGQLGLLLERRVIPQSDEVPDTATATVVDKIKDGHSAPNSTEAPETETAAELREAQDGHGCRHPNLGFFFCVFCIYFVTGLVPLTCVVRNTEHRTCYNYTIDYNTNQYASILQK